MSELDFFVIGEDHLTCIPTRSVGTRDEESLRPVLSRIPILAFNPFLVYSVALFFRRKLPLLHFINISDKCIVHLFSYVRVVAYESRFEILRQS